MFFEPLKAWRHVEVTDQRTSIDYAQQMKYLVDERYPEEIKLLLLLIGSLLPKMLTSN